MCILYAVHDGDHRTGSNISRQISLHKIFYTLSRSVMVAADGIPLGKPAPIVSARLVARYSDDANATDRYRPKLCFPKQ